jgi:hypothetical protein
MGLAAYFRDTEENMRKSFSQPFRRSQRTLPDGTVIDFFMTDVVDTIRISSPTAMRLQKTIMVWNKEPPYKKDESGQLIRGGSGMLTFELDLESSNMFNDPDVESGHYFFVSIINGTNESGGILSAIFSVKMGEDAAGWSIRQGIRQTDGTYKIDGKSATILLAADVKGECSIIAADGQTVLVRKVSYGSTWKLLYIPDTLPPSEEYVEARKYNLEPTINLFKNTEPGFYDHIPEATAIPVVAAGASDSGYTYGAAIPGTPWIYQEWDDAGHHYVNWMRYYWAKRFFTDVQSSTISVGSLWTKVYNNKDNASWVGLCSGNSWVTIDGVGNEPEIDPVSTWDWSPYYGFPISQNHEISRSYYGRRYADYLGGTHNDVESYSWYKDSTHGGFYIRKYEYHSVTSHMSTNPNDLTDCPWSVTDGNVTYARNVNYFVQNGVEIQLSDGIVVGGTYTEFTGTFASGILTRCYKKEELPGETEDVTVVSWKIKPSCTAWDSNPQTDDQTQVGYMAFIGTNNPSILFNVTSLVGPAGFQWGIHELSIIDGTQLYGNGNYVIHL